MSFEENFATYFALHDESHGDLRFGGVEVLGQIITVHGGGGWEEKRQVGGCWQ
jgi:hypothetical protein